MPSDTLQSQHLQIEAMKLAFADLYHYVADPRSMEVTPEQMLDDAYLASRAKLIDPRQGRSAISPAGRRRGGTIYMSAADESGMMVSLHPVATTWASARAWWCRAPASSLQNRGVRLLDGPEARPT